MTITLGFSNPFESYLGISGKYFDFTLFQIKISFHKEWTTILILLLNFYVLIDIDNKRKGVQNDR